MTKIKLYILIISVIISTPYAYSTKVSADTPKLNKNKNSLATSPNQKIILKGDVSTYDTINNIVSLSGNTHATTKQGIIQADKMTYKQKSQIITAQGNIRFQDKLGNKSTMDTLQSHTQTKAMQGTNIKRTLTNNVVVSAVRFKRYENGNMEAEKATYTSCTVHNGKNHPTWLMRAQKVSMDEETQNITFTNSRMELMGIPIYYWPYVEQPTPDVVKKDGWLIPSVASSNTFGLLIKGHYYKSITPNSDILMSPIYTTRNGHGIQALYRKNKPDSILRHDISLISKSKIYNGIQGHWFMYYTKNNKNGWQTKINHENVSQKSYLKKHSYLDKTSKDTLKTSVSATQIKNNSILKVQTASYRDIRPEKKPITVLFPSLRYEKTYLSTHGSVNIQSLVRSMQKRGQLKSNTATTTITYSRPFITQNGIFIKTDVAGRADYYKYRYHTQKTTIKNRKTEDYTNGSLHRFTPMASLVVSYPLRMHIKSTNIPRQIIVEPIAGIFMAKQQKTPYWLPNNDSVDFELDESNLFSNNRYAGVDKIDTGRRFSYGTRLKVWQEKTYIQAFLGQNITRDKYDIASDYIGSLYAKWSNFDIYANFELDSQSFASRKLESNIKYTQPKYILELGYTRINPRENSKLQPLTQSKFGVEYQINKNWRLKTEHAYEFQEDKKGLIRQILGLSYETDCGCFETSFQYKQDFSKSKSTPEKSFYIQLDFREVGNIAGRKRQ